MTYKVSIYCWLIVHMIAHNHDWRCLTVLGISSPISGCLQEMRHNIAEELDRCEEELDREERYGGRRRSGETADFRDTLAGYKWASARAVLYI